MPHRAHYRAHLDPSIPSLGTSPSSAHAPVGHLRATPCGASEESLDLIAMLDPLVHRSSVRMTDNRAMEYLRAFCSFPSGEDGMASQSSSSCNMIQHDSTHLRLLAVQPTSPPRDFHCFHPSAPPTLPPANPNPQPTRACDIFPEDDLGSGWGGGASRKSGACAWLLFPFKWPLWRAMAGGSPHGQVPHQKKKTTRRPTALLFQGIHGFA